MNYEFSAGWASVYPITRLSRFGGDKTPQDENLTPRLWWNLVARQQAGVFGVQTISSLESTCCQDEISDKTWVTDSNF